MSTPFRRRLRPAPSQTLKQSATNCAPGSRPSTAPPPASPRAAAEPARPQVVFYTYRRDEPNTLEDYRYVQKWGRAVRESKSVVKVLVVEQTWTEPGKGGADS